MSIRMLIDASHSEESRVAILDGNRLEEFDFETTTKRQLKGNIYLAKVARIEPSLQAAFVDFGGNRHGFLAFNEIHPDYYRIPIEDREALFRQREEEAEQQAAEEMLEEASIDSEVETLGGEDVEDLERPVQRSRPLKRYKIQEVLARRQVMLVQVVKEERGGKGAALTTYLSLAGRYCVLMPNAMKGGGISRKITNVADRKRLRDIITSINLPDTMSLIVRTAGISRSKAEIKKDCEYLMQLWNDIREKTLESIAPALIYEESDLIKRTIRDYYNRNVSEILIEGEKGYQEVKTFVSKIMPTHLKKVRLYKDEKHPLFHRYGVESQVDAMHNPVVQLKSGGYIVFGTTEALVAIDVNSGKATKERNIEETALKTNLEAAEEIARQLRLRDLAGLVVIDFIDMDETRHAEAVERRLKDTMRHDRARVQVGRISPFGLLELSRQRLRPNIIESTSLPCRACRGSGMIRSVESSSLHVLRALEEEAIKEKASQLNIFVPTEIAFYILNNKRDALQTIESSWKVSICLLRDDELVPPDYRLERVQLRRDPPVVSPPPAAPLKEVPITPKETTGEESDVVASEGVPAPPTRSRSRRRFRKGRGQPREASSETATAVVEGGSAVPVEQTAPSAPLEAPSILIPVAPVVEGAAQKEKPKREVKKKPAAAEGAAEPTTSVKRGARKGWWQRLIE